MFELQLFQKTLLIFAEAACVDLPRGSQPRDNARVTPLRAALHAQDVFYWKELQDGQHWAEAIAEDFFVHFETVSILFANFVT